MVETCRIIGRLALTSCLLAFAIGSADADTLQELATEGLTFTSSPDIEVAAETVSITMETVDFRYELLNKSDRQANVDITIRLPQLDASDPDITYAIPSNDPVNYNGSQLLIDGVAAVPAFRQVAVLENKDVTRRLRDAHIPPLVSQQDDVQGILAGLSPVLLKTLIEDGLLSPNGSRPDGQVLLKPTWSVKTSAVRHQRIEGGQRVTAELHAMNSLGTSQDTILRKVLRENVDLRPEVDRYMADYCVEGDFLRGIDKQSGTDDNAAGLQERRIEIVLPAPSGRDGPVASFHLAIDKGKPDNLITTCMDNLKKTTATRFEVDATEFPLPRRVRVLVVGKF